MRDGIIARDSEHLEIAGCVIANLAGGGISLSGSDSTVRSCDIFNIGRGGISLDGGDRKSLTPANNLAENNHIHHFGIFQRTYAPGIGAQRLRPDRPQQLYPRCAAQRGPVRRQRTSVSNGTKSIAW